MQSPPLEGIRVIEVCANLAGPVAGTILGDLGADVIKIERPGGDDARRFAPPFLGAHGATFAAMNRNKGSVTIDFRDTAQLSALHDLVREADVFIHNLRPGVVESIGLSGQEALALNPRLIYGAISGYGASGPLADRPGYDSMAQGLGGLAMANGEPGGKPCVAAGGVVDKGAGVWLAATVGAALFRRERTGLGAIIDTSLLETALFFVNNLAAQAEATGQPPKRWGSRAPTIVPADCYATKSGFVMLMCGSDSLFQRLAKALGQEAWLLDPEFSTARDRILNRERVEQAVAGEVRKHDREELVSILSAHGVPCSPVLGVEEARHHPQIEAIGIFTPLPDGSGSVVGSPWTIDGQRAAIRRGPPVLGEDTKAVLGRQD